MRAFVVDHHGPDGLRPAEVPTPRPGPGDVLVDVRAASINPLDRMVRDGEFKRLLPYRTPFVLGHDLAGVVRAVGSDVRGFRVGDEVYARPRDLRIGAFAEQLAVDAADVALKPTSLSFAEAAAVPLVALAAWQALVEVADVRPGQEVLVHAGAGGLGSTVIQVAKHLGAHVTTTAHTRDLEAVRALGADEAVDHTTTNVADLPTRYDVVLDSLGADSLHTSLTLLRPGGLAISVVGPPDPAFATQLGHPLLRPVMALLSRRVRRRARRLGVRYSFFFMRADGARLAQLAALYEDGTLRPVLDRTFDFDQTLEAVAHVEHGRARGKVVVTR
ncbi:NADPH:quinone reductase [Nocardioides scoriae]|uniref:NADPH:quinone reductase n=1 Tax=Nocardioides scoriae TaxID=642780 RepID=A0A1H1PEW4_9ACTN|nr:NADP-dependent oxidoreductase [Nocardioides scoriae]SDS09657.1 NADPH:quinone reductase [Nocardioides scoriae]